MSESDRLQKAWDYARSYYQDPDVLEDFERLSKYAPAVFTSYMDMRRGIFESPDAALSAKERELVIVGIEIMARKTNPPPVGHTRKAIDEGATIEEIAEVVAICIMIGGMITYRESGRFVMEAAEEYVMGASGD